MVIDVRDRELVIDGKVLNFPASYEDLKTILGEARIFENVGGRNESHYVYDEIGLRFGERSPSDMKRNKFFVDNAHLITSLSVCIDKSEMIESETIPKECFDGLVTFMGKKWDRLTRFMGFSRYMFREDDEWKYSCFRVYICGEDTIPNYVDDKLNRTLDISFFPEPPKTVENYDVKPFGGECLVFGDFNFKLAVIQELMYEQELIKPRFDIYDYLEFKKSKAKTETEKNIRAAVNFFEEYRIPKEFAQKVEHIYMDGGNEIYSNIAPLWDGEDERFDIKKLSVSELKQFPNLKSMTVMTSDFDKLKKVTDACGIELKLL